MTDPLDRVLSRLDGVVKRNGSYMALCPAHADRNPSLNIKLGQSGKVLLTCYAGCQFADILHALDIEASDLAPERDAVFVVRTIDYPLRDRTGNWVATHTRKELSNGKKEMPWDRGVSPRDLPLYGIHERDARHERVIVVEGEKARDALAAIAPPDVLVVGTVCGASATPSEAVLADLDGLAVILWPDNDDPGRTHMRRIARRLGRDVDWIAWPGAPEKGDAADWAATHDQNDVVGCLGGNADSFDSSDPIELGSEERNYVKQRDDVTGVLPFTSMSGCDLGLVAETVAPWIAEPWVVAGEITKLDGSPKAAGKTTFCLALAKAVIDGAPFLGKPTRKGSVLLVSEQATSSLRVAAERAGLLGCPDFHVVLYHQFAKLDWDVILPTVFAIAKAKGCALVILDTLPAVAKIYGDDENSAGRARMIVDDLRVQLADYACGLLVTFHDRKSGGEVGVSGRGSSAFAGAVDIVLQLSRVGGQGRPEVRRLASLSRYEETPPERFIAYRDGTYLDLGDQEDVAALSIAVALRDVLPREAKQGMPIEDRKYGGDVKEPGIMSRLSANGVKVSRFTLDNVLKQGEQAGWIGRSDAGVKGQPRRYWLLDNKMLSSDAFSYSFISEESILLSSRGQEIDSSDATGASEESISAEQAALFWDGAKNAVRGIN